MLFCLFDLILYVPSTIFLLIRDRSSWVEPVLCLAQEPNAVTPVRLEPRASLSRVMHSTTEPLRSLRKMLLILDGRMDEYLPGRTDDDGHSITTM